MTDPKIQIQELISLGKTEEALAALEQLSSDAILLQARFNGAKKQYNMGLIEFSEWSRIQAQINYSVLEMAKTVNKASNPVSNPTSVSSSQTVSHAPIIFITHSSSVNSDIQVASRMKSYFTNLGVRILTTDDIPIGANIEQTINDYIKIAHIVLVVISRESLVSNWETGEVALDLVLERVSEVKVVPVTLDREVMNPDFYFDSLDNLNQKIKAYQKHVQRAIKEGGGGTFQAELNRLQNAKHQLGLIIEKLKSVRLVNFGSSSDLSDTEFESGMNRIYNRLHNQAV